MDTTKRGRAAAVAAVCVIAAMTAACAGNSAPAPPLSARNLRVTEKEFSISFDKHTVPAGDIKVTVTNKGAVPHELVAFGTKLADDRLPLKGSDVNESGPGVKHYDPEAENIRPGSSKTITLHLPAGQYVFICNLPGHYKSGMRTELTVTQ